jgi:hypothetical protein
MPILSTRTILVVVFDCKELEITKRFRDIACKEIKKKMGNTLDLVALSTTMIPTMPKLMHHMFDAYVVHDRKLLWLVFNYQP